MRYGRTPMRASSAAWSETTITIPPRLIYLLVSTRARHARPIGGRTIEQTMKEQRTCAE